MFPFHPLHSIYYTPWGVINPPRGDIPIWNVAWNAKDEMETVYGRSMTCIQKQLTYPNRGTLSIDVSGYNS